MTAPIDPLASEPAPEPEATITVWFAQKSLNGKEWFTLVQYPGSKPAGALFDVREAESLIEAWRSWYSDPMPGMKVIATPTQWRIVKVELPCVVVKDDF